MPPSDAAASAPPPPHAEAAGDVPAATSPAAVPAEASPGTPAPPARDLESHTHSRKRDREPQPDAVSTKKNRRIDSDSASDRSASPAKPSPTKAGEDEGLAPGVGQIRKKVQDLDWKEKEGKDQDDSQGETGPASVSEVKPEAKDDSDSVHESQKAKVVEATEWKADKADKVDKDGEDGNHAQDGNDAQDAKDVKDGKDANVETPIASGFSAFASKTASTAPKTTQPTFASFTSSSNSSPFVTGASGSKSWLASSTPAAPGLRPSALGSSLGKLGASYETSSPTSTSPAPIASPRSPAPINPAKGKAAVPSTASLGFGSFASGSGFAYAATSSPFSSAAATVTKKAAPAPVETEDKKSNSFVTALEESGAKSNTPDDADEGGAQKLKLEAKAENYWTGEEEETNVFSTRAKLFTRGDKGAWRERGTGTIRVNVPQDVKAATGGRLVMRADGVLRVILNVKLFSGMHCELEQDKFIKIVALEDGELVTFAIRFPNPVVANDFKEAVEAHTPAAHRKE